MKQISRAVGTVVVGLLSFGFTGHAPIRSAQHHLFYT
jgi:hypothetical protein